MYDWNVNGRQVVKVQNHGENIYTADEVPVPVCMRFSGNLIINVSTIKGVTILILLNFG
jgi:hypothetical protein